MKLPNAFYSRRVTETLKSLSAHVNSARVVAASLKPPSISKSNLVPDGTPRPIITSITPNRRQRPASGRNSIKVPIFVRGKNLESTSITAFEAFLEADPATTLPVANLTFNKATTPPEFTAEATLDSTLRTGIYEVRIKDGDGNVHLPGFHIEVEDSAPAAPPPPTVTPPTVTPPTIDRHPWAATIGSGGPQTLSVEVNKTITSPVSYQWLRNKVSIPGANGPKYKIPSANKATDDGEYTVVVWNSAGMALGGPAMVTVT